MPEIGNYDIGLYFHIPFCTKKCPYCHFYVLPNQELLKDLLLESLKIEWDNQLPLLQHKNPLSVYFGGGTPFLFGPERIATLLSWVGSHPKEITLEANPENVTEDAMRAFAEAGINRVSIGVQSLDDSSLAILGRGHSARKAIEAITSTHRAGITNISLDLMYDLPHQTLKSWKETLTRVKELPITHVSLYNLTFEPHTLFFKKEKILRPHLPSPEISLEMLETAVKTLEEIGLRRYEISAFARPGYEAIHNQGYWVGRSFLGFGPSAFSDWEGKRFRNVADLRRYSHALKLGKSPIDLEEKLPYPDNVHERLAVELRLLRGVDLKKYELPNETMVRLRALETKGWLSLDSDRAKLTEQGLLFYDSVAAEII